MCPNDDGAAILAASEDQQREGAEALGRKRRELRDPEAYELIALGGWIARMAEKLESDSQWQEVRRCLDYLAELETVRGFEAIGKEAKRHSVEIAGEYRSEQARLREKHRTRLQIAVSLWEAMLLQTAKRWVLTVRQPGQECGQATHRVQPSSETF